MPYYLIPTLLLIITLICGIAGFGVFIGTAAVILQVCFVVFFVLFLFSLLWDT